MSDCNLPLIVKFIIKLVELIDFVCHFKYIMLKSMAATYVHHNHFGFRSIGLERSHKMITLIKLYRTYENLHSIVVSEHIILRRYYHSATNQDCLPTVILARVLALDARLMSKDGHRCS